MSDHNNSDPKQRIIKEAAALFAKHGFAGVGVREIAKAADVNISMISYYFGGKVGVLKSLIQTYFLAMREIFSEIQNCQGDMESRFKVIIKKMVGYIRENTDLCKVVQSEIHIELPEVLDYKIEMIKQNIEYSKKNFSKDFDNNSGKKCIQDKLIEKYGEEEFKKQHEIFHSIISPAFTGIIFSHFMQKDVLAKLHNVEFNDEFYDTYSDLISSILYKGMSGVIKDIIGEPACN